jgi:hypothetical protein
MMRSSPAFFTVAAAASCSRDIAVVRNLITHKTAHTTHYSTNETILDVEKNETLGTMHFPHSSHEVTHIASTGQIATFFQDTAYFWSTAGRKAKKMEGIKRANTGEIADARMFSPDGDKMLCRLKAVNYSISIISTSNFNSLCDLGDDGHVFGASFDDTGSRVLTTNKRREVTIWNASDCSKMTRIPYHGNNTLSSGQDGHGMAAWAAGGLVAVIESDSWFDEDGGEDEPDTEHQSSTLKVYDPASGKLVHSTDLGISEDADFQLYSRGGIFAVSQGSYSFHYRNRIMSLPIKIFNASTLDLVQDFASANFSWVDKVVDFDAKGEHMLVTSKAEGVEAPTKTDMDGIWDIVTGKRSKSLWLYQHNIFNRFVGDMGRTFAVDKDLQHAPKGLLLNRVQFVDASTDKIVASFVGELMAAGTVSATCDDLPVMV